MKKKVVFNFITGCHNFILVQKNLTLIKQPLNYPLLPNVL